jgi:hypothetical protein
MPLHPGFRRTDFYVLFTTWKRKLAGLTKCPLSILQLAMDILLAENIWNLNRMNFKVHRSNLMIRICLDEMITSVWIKKVSAGTELKVTQENIPAMIPADMCYLGWQESLEKLKKLVEPNIPDM